MNSLHYITFVAFTCQCFIFPPPVNKWKFVYLLILIQYKTHKTIDNEFAIVCNLILLPFELTKLDDATKRDKKWEKKIAENYDT